MVEILKQVSLQFPAGWKLMKLKDIVKWVKGKKPKILSDEEKEGMLPYLTAENIRTKKFNLWTKDDRSLVKTQKNEIILIWDGSHCGECFIGIEGVLASTMVKLVVDNKILDTKYLYYFLTTQYEKLNLNIRGIAIPHLDKRIVENILIPLPPLEEQKRIVAKLDEIFSRIEKARKLREEALKEAEQIMQSALNEIFSKLKTKEKTLKWIKLGEVCKVIRGASPRPKGDPKYFGGNIPWIKISDVTKDEGKFLKKTTETLTNEGKKKSVFLKRGSLIVTNSATIGLPKILDIDGCIHDGFLAFLNLSKNLERDFLYWYFHYIRWHLDLIAPKGTQKNLNTTIAKNIKIPLLSLDEQKRTVEYLDKLQEKVILLKKHQEETQKEIEMLTSSVLNKAFRGML